MKTIFSKTKRKSGTIKRLEKTFNKISSKMAKAKREKERRQHHGNTTANSRYSTIKKEDTF